MITSEYLKRVLPELHEFEGLEMCNAVHEAEGYDGVVALLENLRTGQFPCVVIEDRSIGNISIDSGPLDSYSIPLWIMVQDYSLEPSKLFQEAFEIGKKILKLLIRDAEKEDILAGFDYSRIAYNKRTGPDCYGYEFLLTFRDNIDLSYE